MSASLRKLLAIALVSLVALAGLSTLFYERYIGFARAPLECLLPLDTLAFVSVDHWRLSALRIALDERARATTQVLETLAQFLVVAATPDETMEAAANLESDLLRRARSHFKSQIALAALPPGLESASMELDWTLLARFSGDPNELHETFVRMTPIPTGDAVARTWSTEHWEGSILRSLPLPPQNAPHPAYARWLAWNDLAVAWTVSDGVFYLAPSVDGLKRVLTRTRQVDADESLAQRLAMGDMENHVKQTDLRLFIDVHSTLALVERSVRDAIAGDPGHWMRAVSVPRFFEAAGLAQMDSLAAAMSMTGDQPAYIGARYHERTGLWNAIRTLEPSAGWERPSDLGAFETIGFNLGQAGLQAKDALFKASPLAGLAYWGLRAKLRRDIGYDPDELLRNAFRYETTIEHAIDIGTRRSVFGYVEQGVALDSLYAFSLQPGHPLEQVAQRQFQTYAARYPETVSMEQIRGNSVLYYDSDPDPTLTADRLAICVHEDRLLVGTGTLGLFHRAMELRDPLPHAIAEPPPLPNRVAWGALQVRHPASRLRLLAEVILRQLYPGDLLPPDFDAYDWSELNILEQRRFSTTVDDGKGHLYRTSAREPNP